jgi:hypothetical protein
VAHNFPELCQKIVKGINTNSDYEWDPVTKCFSIQTLPYRSHASNIFFQILDQVMKDTDTIKGKASRMRTWWFPMDPVLSTFTKVPRGVSLDFYLQQWLSKLSMAQQQFIPNLRQVAFPVYLIQPDLSCLIITHDTIQTKT